MNVRSGNCRLRILSDGFAPFEKEVALESSLSIDSLVLQVEGVEATAIATATRSLVSRSDVRSSVDVIDRAQIDASQTGIAVDMLRNVAGADVVQTGNAGGIASYSCEAIQTTRRSWSMGSS